MVRLRLDRRLQGRVDPSDVLREAYLDLPARLPDSARDRPRPTYLWLRLVTGQRLMPIHRHYLGAAMRDAGHEVSLDRGAWPQARSASLATQLLGGLTTASQAADRAVGLAQGPDVAVVGRRLGQAEDFSGFAVREPLEVA